MSKKRSNSVSITKETAKEFLPTELHKVRSIDLKELAARARDAIEGSERSLEVAGDIANSNFLARLWNSGAFAQNVVESIGYIRDISQVNLALSAVCNDLAAANLLHAQKIDANHRETSQQLQDVQQLTGALLEHLRVARDSALLQPIAQGLGQIDATDKDELNGWLQSFSEAIDFQYLTLQEKVKQLVQQSSVSTEEFQSIRHELSRLSDANQNQHSHTERIEAELKRVSTEEFQSVRHELSRLSDANQNQHSHTERIEAELKRVSTEEFQSVRHELSRLSDANQNQHSHTERIEAELKRMSTEEFQSVRHELSRLSDANQNQHSHTERIEAELKRVEKGLQHLNTEYALQKDLAAQRSQAFDATLRQSHTKLGDGLIELSERLELASRSLAAERNAREESHLSILETFGQREAALRSTIIKRLFWSGGVFLLLQAGAFAYFIAQIGGK